MHRWRFQIERVWIILPFKKKFSFFLCLIIMETFDLELHPNRQVHVALFNNVKNASELLQRIATQDKDLTCTLLQPSLV